MERNGRGGERKNMDSSSLRKLAPSLLSSGTTLLQVLNFHDLAEELRQAGRVSRNSSFKNYISRLETLASEAENSADETFRRNAARRIGSALRVLADLQNRGKTEEAPFTYYVVEPLSNIKRLPDVYPADGKVESTLRILAAKGEFEPASFLFYPFADAEKVELNVSDLNGENGSIIPASAVRLKIVKCWYQGGTAWYSYFADSTARELIPELLLNDEKMLKVDTAERKNYLRAKMAGGETRYVPISESEEADVSGNVAGRAVDSMHSALLNENVMEIRDASELQPFRLRTGDFKQIWLTFKAPEEAEGIYSGRILVLMDGSPVSSIPFTVRVLPFRLPEPMTNYNPERRYFVSVYNSLNLKTYIQKGASRENAEKRLYNEYLSLKEHNLLNPMLPCLREVGRDDRFFEKQLEIYRKAGMDTRVIFDGIQGYPGEEYLKSDTVSGKSLSEQPPPPGEWLLQVKRALELIRKHFGPESVIYAFGWDEPSMTLLKNERKPWRLLHELGLKTYSTAHSGHLLHGTYNEDFVNLGGAYRKEDFDRWHACGVLAANYASPHIGPENPDFIRRTHGLDLYKANADGTHNYALNASPWNDFSGTQYNYRSFNMVYPASDGFVETIEYEAFREAVDDVRYATLLKTLAHEALSSGNVDSVYLGRMALQWLALLDTSVCDLNHARLEMINWILKLRENGSNESSSLCL